MSELTFVPPVVQEAMVIEHKYCTWTQSNILDVYDTSCENEYHFYFMEFQDAGFLFCPYCGKHIKDVPYK